jgi:hypothetical protein
MFETIFGSDLGFAKFSVPWTLRLAGQVCEKNIGRELQPNFGCFVETKQHHRERERGTGVSALARRPLDLIACRCCSPGQVFWKK